MSYVYVFYVERRKIIKERKLFRSLILTLRTAIKEKQLLNQMKNAKKLLVIFRY